MTRIGTRSAGWSVLAMLALALMLAGSARAATLQQQRTWGGPASEAASGVAVAPDGSTYLAGNTTSFSADGSTAVFLVKFAPNGSLAWQRTYESPTPFGSDTASEVAVAPDGAVYVTGTTVGVGGDLLLFKFSSDGSLLWQLRWGGAAFENGESVAVAADGFVYVVGGTTTFGTGNDLVLLKFTPAGALVSQQTWGPARGDGIAVGPDGNLYLAGTVADSVGRADIAVLSVSPAGTLLRQSLFSAGLSVDARGGLGVASDGSVYVAGVLFEAAGGGGEDLDALITKFAPAGGLEWSRSWGGRSGDTGEGVAVAPDGTVLFAGNTNSFGSGIDDAFLVRLEPTGRRIDASLWGGAGIDHANDVAVATDGTINTGGSAQAPPWTFQDGPARTSKVRGTVTTPTTPLVPATGTVADPGGTVSEPAGSTTYAGSDDAALLRIGG
jgi:uncharacterized delta-60 repeat protein